MTPVFPEMFLFAHAGLAPVETNVGGGRRSPSSTSFTTGARPEGSSPLTGGAWRAWRSAPVFGIGPCMHQHLWFHFGPSPDGDRDAGTWPTLRNTNFHSFEVHSDWLQLLEDYGIVGFILFLGPALALFLMLLGRLRRESRRRQHEDWDDVPGETHDRHLTGLLVWICMAFHSLGDFNLQMPATTWLFAALLALALTRKTR